MSYLIIMWSYCSLSDLSKKNPAPQNIFFWEDLQLLYNKNSEQIVPTNYKQSKQIAMTKYKEWDRWDNLRNLISLTILNKWDRWDWDWWDWDKNETDEIANENHSQ